MLRIQCVLSDSIVQGKGPFQLFNVLMCSIKLTVHQFKYQADAHTRDWMGVRVVLLQVISSALFFKVPRIRVKCLKIVSVNNG